MADTSTTTGEQFYSGTFQDIINLARTLNIGEGRISVVTQELVNFYQEQVDREVDGILNELYYVPIRMFNQIQPDGTTAKIFPGEVRSLARYWTTGLLILTEFQGIEPNMTEQTTSYIEDSRRKAFRLIRYNSRIQGQEMKSNMSRTMPPSMQMPFPAESDV